LGDGHCGLSVDSVTRILSQNLEEVTEPPPKVQGVRSEYLKGVFNFNGKPLLWINLESLSGLSGEDSPIATSQ
jgi:chemotaxis signal transduction protein